MYEPETDIQRALAALLTDNERALFPDTDQERADELYTEFLRELADALASRDGE